VPGYQPRIGTDHVWFNGTDIHTFDAATGLGIRITELRGWDERPDVRDVRELRSGQDGEYADNLYLGGRTITVIGAVHGSSWVDLQARKRALAAVVQPASTEVLFKVPDPATSSPTAVYATTGMTGYERVSGRVVEAIQFGDMIGSRGMTFQFSMRASDPRVYSDVETSTDSGATGTAARTVTVDQTGTYATPPALVVTGPTASSFSVSEPTSGLSIAINGLTLLANDYVTIDCDERAIGYTSTYSSVRLNRGDVIAQWMLAETSGTTADNAQGAATYDGTYTGGFTLNQSGPSAGIAAVTFNGTTGYVTIPYSAVLNPDTLTIEGWVYVAASGGTQTVIDTLDSNRGWSLELAGGTIWRVSTGDGATTLDSGGFGGTITVGTWNHFAVVVDTLADTVKVYSNGADAVNYGMSGFTKATSGAMQFGRSGTTDYLNGSLSALTMYNSALSAAQVAALYAARTSTTEVSGYSYLNAASSRWANLGTGSSTYTLASSGLGSGSKLNVTYRDARV